MPVTKAESMSHSAEEERTRRERADSQAFPPENLHSTVREMPAALSARTPMQADTYPAGRTEVEGEEPVLIDTTPGPPIHDPIPVRDILPGPSDGDSDSDSDDFFPFKFDPNLLLLVLIGVAIAAAAALLIKK